MSFLVLAPMGVYIPASTQFDHVFEICSSYSSGLAVGIDILLLAA
jgi:hypothetical protein